MKKKIKYNKNFILWFSLVFTTFIADFLSKKWISKNLSFGETIHFFKFIYFTYIKNSGLAFNFLSNKIKSNYWIILITSFLIILTMILLNLSLMNKNKKRINFAHAIITGGSLGNFFDRLIHKSVIDFINLNTKNLNFPIFNCADLFIFIGILCIVINNYIIKKINKK